jgi:oligopeptide transport system substrate-binding protein
MSKLSRVILSLVLAAAMILPAAAFAAEAPVGNVLTIQLALRPNLDIHWNAGSTGALLQTQMYDGLYRYTETGFELSGATSVDVSEDGLTWTFHLRPEAVWTDGKPVTAEDYVNSFRRLVDPAIGTIYARDYGQFVKNGVAVIEGEVPVEELGVKAVDDFTLEIELENVCAFFDALLCYTAFFPLRTDALVEDGLGNWAWEVEHSVTNGPLKMVSCDEEQEIVFVKNEEYWDAANVKLDGMIVKLVDDTNTALSLLTTGAVDLIFGFPAEETQRMINEGYYHTAPNLATNFLLVNCQKEPLSDPLVRKALSLSFDREYLSDVLFSGTKQPAKAYIGNGFPGSTPDEDFRTEGGDLLEYNPDKARELLAEAGFPDGAGFPIIDISYSNTSADYVVLFEYLQAVWEEELGITATLSPIENAAMAELRDAGQFDITPQGWGADYFDASNMLSIFVTDNFINGGRYSSDAYDGAFETSNKTVDNAVRIQLLHDAEETLVASDMGIIPLYHSSYVHLYSEDVLENVKINANAKVMLTQLIVKK